MERNLLVRLSEISLDSRCGSLTFNSWARYNSRSPFFAARARSAFSINLISAFLTRFSKLDARRVSDRIPLPRPRFIRSIRGSRTFDLLKGWKIRWACYFSFHSFASNSADFYRTFAPRRLRVKRVLRGYKREGKTRGILYLRLKSIILARHGSRARPATEHRHGSKLQRFADTWVTCAARICAASRESARIYRRVSLTNERNGTERNGTYLRAATPLESVYR